MAPKMPGNFSLGKISQDATRSQVNTASPSKGYGEWGLAIGRVTFVNYEEMNVKLRLVYGEEGIYETQPIPLTFPSAGQRHFMGGMPQRGDFAVVGWMTQESSGQTSSRTPVILRWFPPPYWMGHDWVIGQDFGQREGMDTPDQRQLLEGVSERIRWKLPHMGPGDVVLSSAQGSDIHLDESLFLTNRRGNEILLRDSDQALVTRSVSQFNVMGGTRVYSGPVQREANLLPTQMFSDGIYWDSPNQVNEDGTPLTEEQFAARSGLAEYGSADSSEQAPYPPDFLTPGLIFRRSDASEDSDFESIEGNERIQPSLDPFTFLKWGLFVTETGFRSGDNEPDAVYGGKALYRVGVDPEDGILESTFNAAVETEGGDLEDMLTEYRIEVTHVTDGTLPVSEQTDGFDADRLPFESANERNPLGLSKTAPFVEFVLGSVVGNDPYSEDGRRLYGVPIVPTVFSPDGTASPGLSSGVGFPIQDHAATLLKVQSPIGNVGLPTFFSVTKDGRLKTYIGGPTNEPYSLEASLASGAKFTTARTMELTASEGFLLRGDGGASGWGFDLRSENGAVKIYGGGRANEGSQQVRGNPNGNEASIPNVLIEGSQNVTVRAGSSVSISAPNLNLENVSNLNFKSLTSLSQESGESISSSTKVRNEVTTGKSSQVFSGPKDALPTNGSVRSTTFAANPATGFVGGTVDEYFALYGNRAETFAFGNTTTRMLVGNLNFETLAGQWRATAIPNSMTLNPAGLTAAIATGNIALNATAGAALIATTVNATMKTAGPAVVSGAASVTLGGPGKVGPIVSGADLDPLTGIPLIALGLGSPGHLIGPPI